ncbi:hypothetical protein [Allorhizocola rhizosphaerae]|uniref:hypothetical protein n=1 Tax=Allorhizocola rhizosphaerae TaxID=1872709 RepID=UPI000E3B93F5|nr:hypothetical protein [Allorhizocola rhizosphaerae]
MREHLIRHPEDRAYVMDVLVRGRRVWDQLSDREFVMHRERLFQDGMAAHKDRLADYELFPGTGCWTRRRSSAGSSRRGGMTT